MSLLVVMAVFMLVLPIERGLTKGRPFDEVSAQMVDYVRQNSAYDDLLWVDGVIPQYMSGRNVVRLLLICISTMLPAI